MKYECIPFFLCDSHLQEGFFEISSHRHGVKCTPTNRSKAYSAAGNQCLDIPLGMLHHSKPGLRRHIQRSTLYLLHFQVRHPCEEYRTPFLRRWVERVQLLDHCIAFVYAFWLFQFPNKVCLYSWAPFFVSFEGKVVHFSTGVVSRSIPRRYSAAVLWILRRQQLDLL